jgi:hypothetical protein
LAPDGSVCSDCGRNCLTPWENYWRLSNGRLTRPQNRSGLFVQEKASWNCRESIHDFSTVQLQPSHYSHPLYLKLKIL